MFQVTRAARPGGRVALSSSPYIRPPVAPSIPFITTPSYLNSLLPLVTHQVTYFPHLLLSSLYPSILAIMTRTERAAFPRAIIKDRAESKSGMDKHIPKNGAGTHNWGSLLEERDLEEAAQFDEVQDFEEG